MYMPPFESAIKADVASGMCSYNKINHKWACADDSTLNRHLRDNMGFDGYIMSDWGAVHSEAKDYLPNGLDQEQGTWIFTPESIQADLDSGKLTMEQLDRAVHRITK